MFQVVGYEPLVESAPDEESLEKFLYWFLKEPIALLTFASNECMWHDSVITFNLMRYKQFQVELVLLRGNSEWPGEHRHPDVDTVEVDLNNAVIFTKNGERRHSPDFQVPVMLNGGSLRQMCNCVRLLPTDDHGIHKVHAKGAVILSVQHWLNGVPPTSVGLNWDGVPVSYGHQQQLETIPGAKHIHTPRVHRH